MSRSLLFIIIFLFPGIDTFSQQREQPLDILLKILELRYDVVFSYADQNIENIFIPEPPEDYSLDEALEYLRQHTGLIIYPIDRRFITISKPDIASLDICGILIDEGTGTGVEGAAIRAGELFAVSGPDGYFELNGLPPGSTILIRHLAYMDQAVTANVLSGKPCRVILLIPQILVMKELVIMNYLTKGIDKRTDGSFIIHPDSLGILPGLTEPDVLHTLQYLPGIQSIDETISNINIRGGTHDQNLVLWDGIKMYQTGHFFGLISAFNPHLTRSVKVIKNGTSAYYHEGVSGTIDMRSDDRTDSIEGGVGINLVNADVFLKIPVTKTTSIHLSSRRSISDIFKTPTYQRYYERAFRDTEVTRISAGDSTVRTDEKFYFFDFGAKLLLNPTARDKIRLAFLKIDDRIQYGEGILAQGVSESRSSSLKQESLAAGISYNHIWSRKVISSGEFYLSSYDLHAVNFDIINNQRLVQQNRVLETGLKIDTKINLTDNLDLFNGYQFSETGIGNLEDINNPPFRRYIKNVLRTHGVFTEAGFGSNSGSTNMRGGLRVNYFEKFGLFTVEPRLSISQEFFNSFFFEILGEMKSQATEQVIDFQNDFLGIEKRRWVLSDNENIPLVTSRQLSMGIHFNKNDLQISLEGYLKRIDGIISSSQGFQNQFEFISSTGSYEARGIDFFLKRRFGKLTAWGNYSYENNNYIFNAFIPQVFPNNFDIRHAVASGTSIQFKNLQTSVGLTWHTGMPYTESSGLTGVNNNIITYLEPNRARLDDYLRVDFSARYGFILNKKYHILTGLSLWNLLNRDNIIGAYYILDDNGELSFIERKSMKFTPNFMVRLEF